jgi:hypothetical protein
MPRTGAVSGRGGSCVITINSSTSILLNITGWEGNLMKNFGDSTDSGNIDSVGQLWRSQVPGDVGMDGTLSAWYDSSGTTTSLIAATMKSDGPFATSLSISSGALFAAWNLDFANIKQTLTVPGSTTVSFTTDFKSNGSPTTLAG